MSVENLKSVSITARDAVPQGFIATGVGAPGELRSTSDYIAPAASASTTSTYKVLRVPTNAKMKHLFLESEAQAAGTIDIGLNYSDDLRDGTVTANLGAVIDQDFFASAISLAAAVLNYDVINESGNNPAQNRAKPLWLAVGLTSDPGGMFDIVITCVSVAFTTGLGKIGLNAEFVI